MVFMNFISFCWTSLSFWEACRKQSVQRLFYANKRLGTRPTLRLIFYFISKNSHTCFRLICIQICIFICVGLVSATDVEIRFDFGKNSHTCLGFICILICIFISPKLIQITSSRFFYSAEKRLPFPNWLLAVPTLTEYSFEC